MKFLRSLLVLSLLSVCMPLQQNLLAKEKFSHQIHEEFHQMYDFVLNLESEFKVGDVLYGKSYGDYEILWTLAQETGETDVIRIYREKEGQQAFVVSYFRSPHILEGRTVIRRFIGPSLTGWRNDTIDAETNEYLGRQGQTQPALDQRDREILKAWGIKLF